MENWGSKTAGSEQVELFASKLNLTPVLVTVGADGAR